VQNIHNGILVVVKRTPLRRKSLKKRVTLRKVSNVYKPPAWFTSLPAGSHGNTPAQKKYWKVVSQYVRQRDFERYGSKCVSCNARLEDWRDGDCAHFKAWSVCNGFFKYELTNLALSCKGCNRLSDGAVGARFGEELKRRYGKKHLEWIEEENLRHRGEKMEVWQIVDRTENILSL